MNNNRIEGVADRGQRSQYRRAFVFKGQAASILRSCTEGVRSYAGMSRPTDESPDSIMLRNRW
ncbi:MAG: hypothetical protein FGM24_11415 [Candidatus Kapabacteria bacterium]|nr:hypothetical protein [Candidatus Kapabacteria bacterium]